MGCCGSAEKAPGGDKRKDETQKRRKIDDKKEKSPPAAKSQTGSTPPAPTTAAAQPTLKKQQQQQQQQQPHNDEKYYKGEAVNKMARSTSSNCLSRHQSEEFKQSAHILLRKQKKGIYEDWEKDRWPWPWMYAKPPHPKRSDSTTYGEFLNCFKILSTGETEAYAAWKGNNKEEARRIMANIRNQSNVLDETLINPDLDDDISDDGKLEQKRSVMFGRHDVITNPVSVDVSKYEAPKYDKSQEDTLLIMETLKTCPLFSHLIRDSELASVASAMKPVVFQPGTFVFKRGEVPSEVSGFYIVKSGFLQSDQSEEGKKYERGSYLGEYVVTSTNSKSKETVEAMGSTDTSCFVLCNEVFTGVMGRQAHEKREIYKAWLRDIKFLRDQTPSQILQLADALEEKRYAQGEKIIEFSKLGDYMHFIVEGEVDVVGRHKDDDGVLLPDAPRYVCSFSPGHPVGYIEFFEVTPSKNIADVVAKDSVITARINRLHFEKCMGAVKDLLRELTEAPEYEYYRSTKEVTQKIEPIDM